MVAGGWPGGALCSIGSPLNKKQGGFMGTKKKSSKLGKAISGAKKKGTVIDRNFFKKHAKKK
jgi:hypothetical protein